MKLLFDQNLSFKLCSALADFFPQSSQVRLVGLEQAQDADVWSYAKSEQFALVSQDADFAEIAGLLGPPPKVIWLRCGNQPTAAVERLLRSNADLIEAFDRDEAAACLEIY
jgi:predicted nuclease of predicted toxin-antitoxin system